MTKNDSWNHSDHVLKELELTHEAFTLKCQPPFTLALCSFKSEEQAELERALGCKCPIAGSVEQGPHGYAIWSGENKFLMLNSQPEKSGNANSAQQCAHWFELSGGRVWLTLAGSRVRDILAKLCPLDLHPQEFSSGHSAMVPLAHIPVHLFRVEQDYHVLVTPSFATSMLHELHRAALEYIVHPSSH